MRKEDSLKSAAPTGRPDTEKEHVNLHDPIASLRLPMGEEEEQCYPWFTMETEVKRGEATFSKPHSRNLSDSQSSAQPTRSHHLSPTHPCYGEAAGVGRRGSFTFYGTSESA